MNTLKPILLLVLVAATGFAQLNSFTTTTLSNNVLTGDTVFVLASATNITAGGNGVPKTYLYVLDPGSIYGELAGVTSVNGNRISVQRTSGSLTGAAHVAGAIVLVQQANMYEKWDRVGGCVLANTKIQPAINVLTGRQWLCSSVTGTWVPGWNNDYPPVPTATVASAAGPITPSGQLFIVSGTAAITGFTLPVGFIGGSFTIIPTGAFTTTNSGNIAIASTAIVGRSLTFTYNFATAKFYPSY